MDRLLYDATSSLQLGQRIWREDFLMIIESNRCCPPDIGLYVSGSDACNPEVGSGVGPALHLRVTICS